jgi:nucleotide-binding universal stress UspA family protein
MVKRILVALSGTPFTPSAMEHAIELAQRKGASVTGVTLVDPARLSDVGPVPIGGATAAYSLTSERMLITQERIEEQLALFRKRCEAEEVPYCVVREEGDPLDQLTSLWRYHDITLIGLRGLFEYGVVHNPDDQIIKMIARGVRPILAVAEKHRSIKRVLIAYNGSVESARAMHLLLHLSPFPEIEPRIVTFDMPEDRATPLLMDAAEYLRAHGFDPEVELMDGSPRDRLLEHAGEWGADMIVMGSTSRTRITRFLLGDTGLHAMRHSEIPLLLA